MHLRMKQCEKNAYPVIAFRNPPMSCFILA